MHLPAAIGPVQHPGGFTSTSHSSINNLFCFVFLQRYIVKWGDAENHDSLTYFFQSSSEFFRNVLYLDPEMFHLQKQLPKAGRHLLSHSLKE
jgi:hypothetical protein